MTLAQYIEKFNNLLDELLSGACTVEVFKAATNALNDFYLATRE